MRKLFTICLILLLCASVAQGIPRGATRDSIGNFPGPHSSTSQDHNIKGSLDILQSKIFERGNATDWFVDSATDGTSGFSWSTAVSTIQGAIALAGSDDIIHVSQGHNQSLQFNNQIVVNVSGLRIKGYGVGPRMPRLDYDAENIESAFVLSASGVIIDGIALLPSVSGISAAMEVKAAAAGAIIRNCMFLSGELRGTDEFNTMIRVASGVWDLTIDNNIFDAGTAGASSAITLNPASGVTLTNNIAYGDYSSACVSSWNNETVKMMVLNNIWINGNLQDEAPLNTEPAWALRDGCQGVVQGNTFMSDSAHGTSTLLQQRTGLDMMYIQNAIGDDAGEEFNAAYGFARGTTSITSSSDG